MATDIASAVVAQKPYVEFQPSDVLAGQPTTEFEPKPGNAPGATDVRRKYSPGGGFAPAGVDQCKLTTDPAVTAMELLANWSAAGGATPADPARCGAAIAPGTVNPVQPM